MNKDNTLCHQLLPVYWFTLLCMIFKNQINRLKTGKTLHTVFNASNYAYAANMLHMIFAHIQEFVTSHILHHGMNLNSRVILSMLNLSNLFVWIVMWGAFQWKRYFNWLFALGDLGTFILPSFTDVYSATCLVHVMEKMKVLFFINIFVSQISFISCIASDLKWVIWKNVSLASDHFKSRQSHHH